MKIKSSLVERNNRYPVEILISSINKQPDIQPNPSADIYLLNTCYIILYEQTICRNSRGFASDLAGDNFYTGLLLLITLIMRLQSFTGWFFTKDYNLNF